MLLTHWFLFEIKKEKKNRLNILKPCTQCKQTHWSVPFRKNLLVLFSEVEQSVFKTKSFHLQYDSFQISNKTNFFGIEIWYFITIHYQKVKSHCRSETNHTVNEMFSFPKRILFISEKEQLQKFFTSVNNSHFTYFLKCGLKNSGVLFTRVSFIIYFYERNIFIAIPTFIF